MIFNDRAHSRVLSSGLISLGFFLFASLPASADTNDATQGANVVSTVTLVSAGRTETFATTASSIGDLLQERGIRVGRGDYVSAPLSNPVTDGSRVLYRSAETVKLVVGSEHRTVRSSAENVGALLVRERVALGPGIRVSPRVDEAIYPGEVVRVERVRVWTRDVPQRIAPTTKVRSDRSLPAGTVRTISRGRAGIRVTKIRIEQHDGGAPTKTVLGYRILRSQQPRIVVHGSGPSIAFAGVAARGFSGALHFVGAALHVIATAYTASCYGCSGFTKSGAHAGYGVVAVDPHVIPLGTKLFVPGYGRAVAGDTGGSIVGHRVDLGFDKLADALQFGRRTVTVYVVK